MKNKFIIILFCIICIGMISCTEDSDTVIPQKDPEGTITISLYKNTNQNLDGIIVDVSDKFTSIDGRWLFNSIGAVKGLDEFSTIPKGNWEETVYVRKGYGYIAFNTYSKTFYRIFVSNSASDEMGTITGFQVKYLKPFYGVDEPVSVESDIFTVPAKGAFMEVNFTNSSIIPFRVTTDCEWIDIIETNYIESGFYGFSFKTRSTNSLTPTEGDIRIVTFNEKVTTITIKRDAMAPLVATTSILEFKKKYWEEVPNYCRKIEKGTIIRGRVISSDQSNNVFKTITIDDGTAAIPILINSYYLHHKFPYGQEIAIQFNNDIYVGRYGGLEEIGAFSDYTISFLSIENLDDCQIIGDPDPLSVTPIDTSIEFINNLNQQSLEACAWQSRYIKLSDVAFREQGVPMADSSNISATNRIIYDASGFQINVRTSCYADFRDQLTPKGVGNISGLLSYYNGTWQLILNSWEDVGDFDPNAVIDIPSPNPPEIEPVESTGDGSEDAPYNVSKVVQLGNPGDYAWVEGYIVGYIPGVSLSEACFDCNGTITSNILLGDDITEIDISKCIPIQLVPASAARINLNLQDHPENFHRKVRVYGTLSKYFGVPGVKNVSDQFGL